MIDGLVSLVYHNNMTVWYTMTIWYMMFFSDLLEGSNKSEKLQLMFEDWCQSNEDWNQSSFLLRIRTTHSNKVKGARRWLTEQAIAEKYKSAEIAKEIVAAKLNCEVMRKNSVRPHPDMPHRKDLQLYLCWDESFETSEVDTVVESLFEQRSTSKDSKGEKKERRANDAAALAATVATVVMPRHHPVPVTQVQKRARESPRKTRTRKTRDQRKTRQIGPRRRNKMQQRKRSKTGRRKKRKRSKKGKENRRKRSKKKRRNKRKQRRNRRDLRMSVRKNFGKQTTRLELVVPRTLCESDMLDRCGIRIDYQLKKRFNRKYTSLFCMRVYACIISKIQETILSWIQTIKQWLWWATVLWPY